MPPFQLLPTELFGLNAIDDERNYTPDFRMIEFSGPTGSPRAQGPAG